MLKPTPEQRTHLKHYPHDQIALVQFLAIENQTAFEQYRLASERAVKAQGGQRTHDVNIDQILAGGNMPYQAITVAVFASSEAALTAFDAIVAERQAALADIYALVVRPVVRLPRIAKGLGFLAPLLRRVLGTTSERAIPGFAEFANPEKGPVPETLAALKAHDQTTPFYMMNLNKYYPKARYDGGEDVSGERAYNRYATRILPYLISVGGYPDLIGHVECVFVGGASSPLHDTWSDFAMVYYPSRQNFINMMTHSPKKGVHHQDAGLERAVLMPSSDWR